MKKLLSFRQRVSEVGLAGAAKELGWKLIVAIFFYYLVRDSILYLGIPLLIKLFVFDQTSP